MAKVINASRLSLALPSGHRIERESTLAIPDDMLDGDNAATLSGLERAGLITIERTPDPVPEPEMKTETVAEIAPETAPVKKSK